jgi:RNA polymerase sigma-70 factor, ECF subfamily
VIISADWLMRSFWWNRGGSLPGGFIRSAASSVVIMKGRGDRGVAMPDILFIEARRDRVAGVAEASGHVDAITSHVPDDPERDRALMRRVRARDDAAFADLYDHYAAQVNGVAYSILRSPALAEEATHDVFLRLWQQPDAFDPARGTFAGWLLRVARNRAIDVLRRRREDTGNGTAGDVSSWIADPAPGPEEEALDRIRRLEVRQALDELAPDHRQLLELAYFAGMSQTEIAAHLGRPLGTVKSQIRAAMGRLAERLVASGEVFVTEPFTDREKRA